MSKRIKQIMASVDAKLDVLQTKKAKGSKKVTETEFKLSAPQAQSVFIAGDFNQWNPSSHPLKADANGTWRISFSLIPGRYEYRFLVDREWQNDPCCSSFVENPFGSSNSLKIVE
jgi:1,4-alpha-glucan branching enzyme